MAPTQEGAWPVVVLAHGDGDTLDFLADWASGIAGQGAATYNVTYPTTIGQERESAESLACALRVAVNDAAAQGADTSRVVLVGHSLGGGIGAAVSLGGDSASPDCVVDEGDVLPNAFVGYEGTYDWATAPGSAHSVGSGELGGNAVADPYTQIGGNPELVVRLLQGDAEDMMPLTVQEEFAQALDEAGYDVESTVVKDGQHAVLYEGTPAYQAVLDQVSDVLSTL